MIKRAVVSAISGILVCLIFTLILSAMINADILSWDRKALFSAVCVLLGGISAAALSLVKNGKLLSVAAAEGIYILLLLVAGVAFIGGEFSLSMLWCDLAVAAVAGFSSLIVAGLVRR